MSRWAVVLAGGIGSRFWPLSTPTRPKQLLPLVTEKPLLQDAIDRLAPIVDPAHTLVLTNVRLVKPIRALLPPIPRENIIAEPRPAGTAAALTWAALTIQRRDSADATMMSIHADWAIGDDAEFRNVSLEDTHPGHGRNCADARRSGLRLHSAVGSEQGGRIAGQEIRREARQGTRRETARRGLPVELGDLRLDGWGFSGAGKTTCTRIEESAQR